MHLNFVKQIFVMQAEAGRHAHVEQPAYAKSWKTRALRDLPGYFVYFDQCMLGLKIPGEGPVRKRTAFRTTKSAVVDALLPHQCDGTHEHTALKGAVAGTGLDKTKYAENYPEELCKKLADAIMGQGATMSATTRPVTS